MVSRAFDDELHAKLETSVTNGVVGVLEASSLALSLIGAGLASSQGLDTKHAVKQVDRLLSSRNLQLEQLDLPWVHFSMYWPDPEEPDERNLHGSDEDLAKARAAFRSQPTPAYVVTIEP